MPDGLKIIVGADTQEAGQKIKSLEQDVTKSFDKISTTVASSGKAFTGFDKNVTAAGAGLKTVSKQVSIFEGSIETLQARIGARKSFLNTETDLVKIKQLNKEISLLEIQVNSLQNAGRVSMNKIGAAIQQVGTSARGATQTINVTGLSLSNLGAGASKAFAGLLRLSYLLPGIGFAGLFGGILTVAGALVGLGTSAKDATVDLGPLAAKLKEAEDKQKAFKDAIDNASASVVGQALELKELKAVLIDINSEFTGLTQNIINQAIAQVLFDKKNLAVQKLLSAEAERRLKIADMMLGVSALPQIDQDTFSKDPLRRQASEAKNEIRIINLLAKELGVTFEKMFKPDKITKFKEAFRAVVVVAKPIPIAATLDIKEIRSVLMDEKVFAEKVQDRINAAIKKLVITPQFTISERGRATDQAIKFAEDIGKAFSEGLATTLSSATSGIGEIIGTALGGGDIGNAFKAFAASIGDALQAMGKQIIAIGVAALLAKEALATLFANPVTAILAGTALVAAGAALKNILSGGIKGFAQGGLVSGPQLALIGEGSGTSRSNPEVVAPLDKLRGMLSDLGGQGGSTRLYSKIRGKDIVLSGARTSRSQKRTTGR